MTAIVWSVPLNKLLRKKLLEAGVRPVDLAKHLGVSPQMGTMLLKGQRDLAIWHLPKLAALLGVSVPELVTDVRDLPRHSSEVQTSGSDTPSNVVSSANPVTSSSPEDPRAGAASLSSDEVVVDELIQAAFAFKAFAAHASEWYRRLTDLALTRNIELDRQQIAVSDADAPQDGAAGVAVSGQPDRAGRRHRGHDRKVV